MECIGLTYNRVIALYLKIIYQHVRQIQLLLLFMEIVAIVFFHFAGGNTKCSHILRLWHNNEHGDIALVHNGLSLCLNLKGAGSNPLTVLILTTVQVGSIEVGN